jgi:hypothetical protein
MKTLDVHAKEWFDKVNGNSYCAVQITVDFGLPTELTIYSPFQYGYGDFYNQAAKEALADFYGKKKDDFTYFDLREQGVIIRSNIERKCKKRDVIAWGRR